MNKNIIPILVVLLLLSSSFVGVSNPAEELMPDVKVREQTKIPSNSLDWWSIYRHELQNITKEDFTHTVFCEYGASTTCRFCPNVSHVLNELFDPDNPDFYYCSLVHDVNLEARRRLDNDYNLLGIPTCYFDGGYEVKFGSKGAESIIPELIESCGQRVVPNLSMNITMNWLGDAVFNVSVVIQNNENENYTGHLRAYIVEIISRWIYHHSGNPIHYAFLHWAFNKNISIDAEDTYYDNTTWDGKEYGFSDINWENIMVIAAVFNDEWHQGYSFPPSGNPFDAYYVDETVAARFITTPPNTPTIKGPTRGKIGVEYNYTFVSTDPDGDDIWYHICWGDKEIIYIYGPYHSGEPITLSYNWTEKGNYTIQCKASDVYNEESDWAYLEVTMPHSYQSNWWMGWSDRFPLLQWLLGWFIW
ncbi:MAG: hypothetical protein JSW60_08865 [Thermoplasmatales archaeon]|nr:MAG: hypothetical protein JSW60_08865 [Thermoplasmatales archaeon]